jgi:hypothetical protein
VVGALQAFRMEAGLNRVFADTACDDGAQGYAGPQYEMVACGYAVPGLLYTYICHESSHTLSVTTIPAILPSRKPPAQHVNDMAVMPVGDACDVMWYCDSGTPPWSICPGPVARSLASTAHTHGLRCNHPCRMLQSGLAPQPYTGTTCLAKAPLASHTVPVH